MSPKEIRQFRCQLVEILKQENRESRSGPLQELAQKVGASVCRMEDAQNRISELEVVNGIQHALQTASMINMAEAAARCYWFAFVASLIALLSAAAAWVAVFVQILGNMKQLYL